MAVYFVDMRISISPLFCANLVVLASSTWMSAIAQTAVSSSQPMMPQDPTAIMMLATQVNGLNSPDLKPWHIKVAYQIFDENGQSKNTGIFEEWWVGPTKYKASYTSPGFTQTIYSTASGYFQVGDNKTPSLGEQMLVNGILRPLPSTKGIEGLSFDKRDMDIGTVVLQCITGRPKQSPNSPTMPTYCFGKDLPAIRVTASGPFQSIYNSSLLFEQHYVAKQVHITNNQKPLIDANVSLLEAQEQLSDADLTPPTDATRVSRRIRISSGILASNLLSKTRPIYPDNAQQSRVQGTVVLQATISTSGAVEDLKAISGPPILQQSAMDAVKAWRYKPYVLNGEPVEVESQINVIFNLDH
jgi:TonB family protein